MMINFIRTEKYINQFSVSTETVTCFNLCMYSSRITLELMQRGIQ